MFRHQPQNMPVTEEAPEPLFPYCLVLQMRGRNSSGPHSVWQSAQPKQRRLLLFIPHVFQEGKALTEAPVDFLSYLICQNWILQVLFNQSSVGKWVSWLAWTIPRKKAGWVGQRFPGEAASFASCYKGDMTKELRVQREQERAGGEALARCRAQART